MESSMKEPIFYHQYIPEEFKLQMDKLDEIAARLSAEWCNRAEGWARDCAIETLPHHIFHDIDVNKFECSQATRDYLAKHVIQKEYPDRIEFWHKGKMHPNVFKKPSL
jgi:hypothetical protein